MKQTLQIEISQHLALSPQLQQSIRLLQLSTLELNQEIEQALQDNPLLERDELAGMPEDAPDSAATDEAQDHANEADEGSDPEWGSDILFGQHGSRDSDDDTDAGELQAAATGLREHLGSQLALTQLGERERSVVAFLIEALDSDGYLAQSLAELVETLAGNAEVDREELLEELNIGLRHLQQFDPSGIGARTPQECLDLQLRSMPDSATRDLARRVIRDHLDQLAAHDYAKIGEALACSDDELRDAQTLIKSLNPRPGAQYAPLDTRYVIPDVIVRKQHGRWQASLNDEAMPHLHIHRLYANILQSQRRRRNGSASGLTGQLQEAKRLIKNVQQRFDTIQRVAQAIVDRQRAFFDHGELAMRPLLLREIADIVGMHESTISRVTTQKYLASPRGIFELKYFFGSHVATDTGGAASSTAIRALIKQLVGAEDGHKPLSDAKIAEILGAQGIMVARRTVAKYREALNIAPVNLRKAL
ncbi:MAG: RNA polymerase factor sigma-54 [Zoogloeaceae bacterium]|jgi:RNA polymerase sigma-54 factor|nr:RNA polymerase factor sigma-54 [Zoogloeaceae bacterium]